MKKVLNPKKNNSIKLGEAVNIISGAPFDAQLFNENGDGLPLIRVRDVNTGPSGYYYSGKFSAEHLIKTNDLLISMDGDFKVVRWKNGNALLNQRVCKIVADEKKLDKKYLEAFLPKVLRAIHRETTFTTVKHLSVKDIREIDIPLPPLDDQKRIAHLLGKVEGMIALRKQHLQHLDALLKSVFLDMFGIQDASYKRWPVEKLVSHSEIVSGVTKGKKYKKEELFEVPYMRVANVQDGYFVLDEIKTITVTRKEISLYQLKRGDLLLTEGGDPDKLGRGAVWEEQIANCIHQNHIFRVRISNLTKINPHYLSALVGSKYGKSYFLKSAKQTTGIASINSTQLKNLPIIIPPIKLQNQFAAIVEKVEGLKSRYQQSLSDLQNVYNALSQKAFKGELDLSRVRLPVSMGNVT